MVAWTLVRGFPAPRILRGGLIVFFADNPLASNFSILDGSVTVTVPDVEPGVDYTVVREYILSRSFTGRELTMSILASVTRVMTVAFSPLFQACHRFEHGLTIVYHDFTNLRC